MSQRERDRLKGVHLLESGQIDQRQAAQMMGLASTRQVRRIVARVRAQGDGGVMHGLRGRPSNRGLPVRLRQAALELLAAHYADFEPTLAAETLAERHGLAVHPETLRLWMRADGRWPRRRKGRRVRQRRPRRACFGALVQWDTSIHDWLEGRGPASVLIAMIDDATSRLWARFCEADTTAANMGLLKDYLERFGRPLAIYCDQASHFVAQQEPDAGASYQGRRPLTQIGRALGELNIELIAARSPQAKGRVERLFRTLQDRLIKGLRLAGACTLEQANAYLEQCFVAFWNQRYAITPAEATDLHRDSDGLDLAAILSHQEERRVNNDWTVQWDGRRWQITRGRVNQAVRPGGRVIVEERLDGSLRMRWKGDYLQVRAAATRLRPSEPEGERGLGLRPQPLPPSGSNRRKPSPHHPWKRGHF